MNKHLMQSQTNGFETQTLHLPLWVSIVVTFGALLTTTGAVISKVDPALLTHGSTITEATRVYADYMFARSL